MRKPSETQAVLCGEGPHSSITGCVRVSPMHCGSVVQTHIRGLPCHHDRLGFVIELFGQRRLLPCLPNACGEAILSFYTDAFTPCETVGARIILTCDPCSCMGKPIACGVLAPSFKPGCCPPDPRPLFAAPIRR